MQKLRKLKHLKESLKLRTLRWLALGLCAAVLAAAVPVGLASRHGVTQAAPVFPELSLVTLLTDPGALLDAFLNTLFDVFWETFEFMDFMMYPRSGLVYNQKNAFQSAFGYNELYDKFAFTMNVYADTMRCKFTYDDRDWLVQMWKGAYATFLCTGGEIGVYAKPTDRLLEHYDSVQDDPSDWLGMEMIIYKDNELLFTRPFDQYWWCTGYQISYLPGFYRSPRTNCAMESRLQFKNAEMAGLFADELARKGFVLVPYLLGPRSPECYTVDEDTVCFVWKNIAE